MPRMTSSSVYTILTVALFATLTAVSLSSPYVYHQDENYYMASTRDMLDRAEYLIPQYNGTPRINKPILFYWLLLIPQSLWGAGFAPARTASCLASIGLLALVWFGSRGWFSDARRRVLCVAAAASMDIVFRYAHYAVPEMTLTLFMTAAHLSFWRYARETGAGRSGRVPLMAMYLASALAFSIKGPVGVLLPFLSGALWFALNGRARRAWSLISIPGLLLLALVIVPWYVMLMAELGVARMLKMMGGETAGRIVNFTASPFYYAPVLLLYFFPWTLFPLARAPGAIRRSGWRGVWNRLKTDYAFIWFLTDLAFYSLLIGEKHQWYALQWTFPLVILCVRALYPEDAPRPFNRIFTALASASLGLAVMIAAAYGYFGALLASATAVYLLLALLAAGGVWLLVLTRRNAGVPQKAAVVVLISLGVHFAVFQYVLPTKQIQPVPEFAAFLQQQTRPFSLLLNDRYIHKKLFLYDIPAMRRMSLQRDDWVFQASIREDAPDFIVCRDALFHDLDLTHQNEYDPVLTGWFKMPKGTPHPIERVWRFLLSGDVKLILDPVSLYHRRENVTP
ncbi:MAG: phospholipid carrier-dependent glycosyltransferase [bacterium]|nr:phospholipid carrier-dependent glycosyltransferase [bacterium]